MSELEEVGDVCEAFVPVAVVCLGEYCVVWFGSSVVSGVDDDFVFFVSELVVCDCSQRFLDSAGSDVFVMYYFVGGGLDLPDLRVS